MNKSSIQRGRHRGRGWLLAALIASACVVAPAESHATGSGPSRVEAASSGSRLVIPAIKLDKPLIEGWTNDINAGRITLIGDCWPGTPRTAVLPCSTTWIAGHRTTHGAPFRKLPSVPVGALVTIVHDGVATTYQITSKIVAKRYGAPSWIFHQDLLLQCSHGKNEAWVLSGTLVSSTPV